MKLSRIWLKAIVMGLAVMWLAAGCLPAMVEEEAEESETQADGSFPSEITGTVHWLYPDVSSWPQTATLNASVGGGTINLSYDKAKVWHAVGGANANPWVFAKLNGQWYAATFEYLRYGQTAKPMGVLNASDHIKVAPLNKWRPRSGERIGLMVSGLVRGGYRNVKERSNIVMVTWP